MKRRGILRSGFWAFFIVIALTISTVPAQAAAPSNNTNQQETPQTTQENSQQEPAEDLVYEVVTDKWGILTQEQVQNIEAKVSELTEIDVAVYIELVDSQTCNQKYANALSESMYTETFGEGYRNGIMIVFSFYEEANCYYAVHYGGNVQLSESKVSRTIEGTYHDFKTDATWVEGAFIQCVDYFKTLKLATSDGAVEQLEETEHKPIPVSTILIVTIFVAFVITIIVLGWNYVHVLDEYKQMSGRYNEQREVNYEVRSQNGKLSKKLSLARAENDKLLQWKVNAIAVYPTIQNEINEWVAKNDAKRFDENYEDIIQLDPIMENFDSFDKMLSEYEKLSVLAKKYVTLDMTIASQKRQEAAEAYAASATQKIETVCHRCSGSRHSRSELNSTYSYYRGLPMFVQMMIAQQLVMNLTHKKDAAERDYKRYQDSQQEFYSSHSSSSDYGGTFGGGLSGGGTFGGHVGGGH